MPKREETEEDFHEDDEFFYSIIEVTNADGTKTIYKNQDSSGDALIKKYHTNHDLKIKKNKKHKPKALVKRDKDDILPVEIKNNEPIPFPKK